MYGTSRGCIRALDIHAHVVPRDEGFFFLCCVFSKRRAANRSFFDSFRLQTAAFEFVFNLPWNRGPEFQKGAVYPMKHMLGDRFALMTFCSMNACLVGCGDGSRSRVCDLTWSAPCLKRLLCERAWYHVVGHVLVGVHPGRTVR